MPSIHPYRRLTFTCTGSLSVPLLLVAPPLIALNGYVLVILYVLSAFSAATPNLPANRSLRPPQLNACSLVTRADVEEAVGRSMNDGDEETLGRASSCHYATKGGLVSISIQKLAAKPDLQ